MGPVLRLCSREKDSSFVGGASRTQVLVGSREIQSRREKMNPLVGMRWRPPQELSVHLWHGSLCPIGPNEQELVSSPRYGTGLIRAIAAARAGLPRNGVVFHSGHTGVLTMRQ